MTPPTESTTDRIAFSVTWDYRCPFARNAHEHVLTAVEAGAPFDVTYVPFSLSEMHVADGDPSAFDDPTKTQDLLAVQVGLVVRDRMPKAFLRVHRALFALRHDAGLDLRDEAQLRATLAANDVDADAVFAEIKSGWPLDTFRKEHDAAERDHAVWGVPTFIVGDQAAFVRLMTRPDGDGALAHETIQGVVEMFSAVPGLNEFKHTSISN